MNKATNISLLMFLIGTILIIVPFQFFHKQEWCYDVYSLGLSLFTSASFVLVLGLSKKYKTNDLHLLRIPTASISFMTIFDACKELVGKDDGNSTFELICFILGLITTIIVQYAIYRKHTD